MISIDGLLDLVKSETDQKKVISPVALSENLNYHVHTVPNDLISAPLSVMLQG